LQKKLIILLKRLSTQLIGIINNRSQNSLDIRDHFGDINLMKKNQDELRMQALQKQEKEKKDKMHDMMIEKLNNHNEKLKAEFEKEREKLHKESQRDQFNAHLKKDAEIKSYQKVESIGN